MPGFELHLKAIIESLIFASQSPIKVSRIAQVLEGIKLRAIKGALDDLIREFQTSNRGFFLEEVADGFQFRTKPGYQKWVKKLTRTRPDRFSQASLETLAIVAYRQPVVRSDIEQIRGVDTGGVLKFLLEKHLIKILGRKAVPGRPIIYGTGGKFLEIFGLKDLKDLPSLREIERLND